MIQSSNGSQSNKKIDSFFEVSSVHTQGNEHLSGTFTVTNIAQLFLASGCKDKVNFSWEIIETHFFITEGEVLGHVYNV